MENQLSKLQAIPITTPTETYYVFVSDEEIKMNELFIYLKTNEIFRRIHPQIGTKDTDKKIEYQSKPIHKGIPVVECPWEIDVEKLADKYVKAQPIRNRGLMSDRWNATGFINGCSNHAETHPFTEEDMLEFSWWLSNNMGEYNDDRQVHFNLKYYLNKWKSLKQPKVYQVEIELKSYCKVCDFPNNNHKSKQLEGEIPRCHHQLDINPTIKLWKQI